CEMTPEAGEHLRRRRKEMLNCLGDGFLLISGQSLNYLFQEYCVLSFLLLSHKPRLIGQNCFASERALYTPGTKTLRTSIAIRSTGFTSKLLAERNTPTWNPSDERYLFTSLRF